MARGFRIDLRKFGEQLPQSLQRVGRGAANASEKPLVVADAVTFPEHAFELSDSVTNPVVSRRLRRCTIQTRAHLLGIADLPALQYGQAGGQLSVVLMRVRVERPDGDVETCVRQNMPPEIRRLAPGSSLRALAHEDEPRIVAMDWKTTAERLGLRLTWARDADQFAWPDPDEWPALDAIEVRDTGRHRRRLEARRAEWTPTTARLRGASSRGGWLDGRQQWSLDLDVEGRAVTVKERVPDLALAKLIGFRDGPKRLSGAIATVETVVAEDAPIAALVSRDGEVAVDWEATLNQPEMRDTDSM